MIHCFSIPLQRRAGSPMMSIKHNITRYNKNRHKPSCQGWTRQSNRTKRVPRAGERVRDTPTSTVRSTTNTPSKTITACVHTHAASMIVASISMSPYESCLLYSEGCVFLVSSTPLAPTILLSPGFTELCLMFGFGCLSFHFSSY